MVVTVAKHKTAWKHGPAKIILTKAVYSWLKLFVSKVVCGAHNLGCAFVTVNGGEMTSSMINKSLQSTWRKAELGDQITCTLVRKAAVSAVHQEARDHIGNLADLMNHQTATAEKCYRMVNREKTCVATAKTLSDLTGLNSDKQHSARNAAEASAADTGNTDRRAVWKDKQVKDLQELFRDEINAGEIAFQSVKTKLKKCSLFRHYTDRQVFDKLRREVSKSAEQGSADLSLENEQRPLDTDESDIDSDCVIPPSTNSGVCKVFSSFEALVLIEKCGGIIKADPTSHDCVKEILNCSQSGLEFLDKFTMPQIINRLKYEREKLLLFSGSK